VEKLVWTINERLGQLNVGFAAAALIGTMDGVNATFLLQPAPQNGVMIFRGGTLLAPGPQPDAQYTVSGAYVTFNAQAIPEPGVGTQAFVW
jgi:hypothetical protein